MIWAASRAQQQGGHLFSSDEHCDSLSYRQATPAQVVPLLGVGKIPHKALPCLNIFQA